MVGPPRAREYKRKSVSLGALKAWRVCEVSEETCPRLKVTFCIKDEPQAQEGTRSSRAQISFPWRPREHIPTPLYISLTVHITHCTYHSLYISLTYSTSQTSAEFPVAWQGDRSMEIEGAPHLKSHAFPLPPLAGRSRLQKEVVFDSQGWDRTAM